MTAAEPQTPTKGIVYVVLALVTLNSSAVKWLTALGVMPLADVIAVTLAAPLFATALAGPPLGERIGWRRRDCSTAAPTTS